MLASLYSLGYLSSIPIISTALYLTQAFSALFLSLSLLCFSFFLYSVPSIFPALLLLRALLCFFYFSAFILRLPQLNPSQR